jgi:hypothetical protein
MPAHRIVNAVKKRQSARIVAGSHLGAVPSARPQKLGEKPPQSDLEARKQYVRQYIEYTALSERPLSGRDRVSQGWKRSGCP